MAPGILNRNAVSPSSPGLALRLPWDHGWKIIQPQSGCVISSTNQNWAQPPCGWESTNSLPRVAEAATLGW